MTKWMLLMALIVQGSMALALPKDEVIHVRDTIEPVLFQIKGVNSIGIGQCYVGTSTLVVPGTLPASEYCIAVGLETQAQLEAAKALFQVPFRVHGVGIAFEVTGKITEM